MHIDTGLWDAISEDEQKSWQERWQRSFYQSFEARNWKYNDIVGYIGLFAGKNQIKAEYWFIDAKRISRRLIKKNIVYRDKLFEFTVNQNYTSQDILDKLMSHLSSLSSHSRLKKRYIDLEAYCNISPTINWSSLIKDPKK